MIQFTIKGVCYSMKNSKTLTWRGGRIRTIKHEAAIRFENDFLIQVPPEAKRRLANPVRVTVRVWYPSRRQDLSCELVYDLLQKSGVIENDRQVQERHEYGFIDKENPRVEVEIVPIDEKYSM